MSCLLLLPQVPMWHGWSSWQTTQRQIEALTSLSQVSTECQMLLLSKKKKKSSFKSFFFQIRHRACVQYLYGLFLLHELFDISLGLFSTHLIRCSSHQKHTLCIFTKINKIRQKSFYLKPNKGAISLPDILAVCHIQFWLTADGFYNLTL